MKTKVGIGWMWLAISMMLVGCMSSGPTGPTARTGAEAEVTHDGLVRVDHAGFAAVWVKPEAGINRYKSMIVVQPSFHYRSAPRRGSLGAEFEVPERKREKFEEVVTESFANSLASSKYYTLATAPGPDTLLIVSALHDVVSYMPPQQPGRDRMYVTRFGEATLILELRDSQTNEVLARVAERRAVEPSGGLPATNQGSALLEIRQMASHWGTTLRRQLDALHER